MVKTDELTKIIDNSGLKKERIAEYVGISRQALYNKVHNINYFTVKEVKLLCEILKITRLTDKERIFFASEVDKNGNTVC